MLTNAKELIERSARAAGYDPVRVTDDGVVLLRGVAVAWDPANDNGDALRLAVALHMDLHIDRGHCYAKWARGEAIEDFSDGDTMAATRRAILRAAGA